MKIYTKRISTLFMILFALLAFNIHETFAAKTVYVKVAVLNIRSKPTTSSKVLGQVFLAEKININAKTKKKETIGGIEDYWVRFDNGDKKGWLFNGFLSDKPVLTAKEMAKKMTGTYYYSTMEYQDMKSKNPDPGNEYSYNAIDRILTIDGDNYTERWFNYQVGISDIFTGKVIYQADSIELSPVKRLSRPSVYLWVPRDGEEENAYSSAYHDFSTDAYHLTTLSEKRAPLKSGKIKYYFYNKDGVEYMLIFDPYKEKREISKSTWCYRKVEGK